MLGKHHAVVGAACYAGVLASGLIRPAVPALVAGFAVAVGSAVSPDIDSPATAERSGSIAYQTSWLGLIGRIKLPGTGNGIWGAHRTRTHTGLSIVVVAAIAFAAYAIAAVSTLPAAIVAGLLAGPAVIVRRQWRKTALIGGTLLGGALAWAIDAHALAIGLWMPLAATVGWASHVLIGDFFSDRGVPLFHCPVVGPSWRRHGLHLYSCDDAIEKLVALLFAVAAVVATYLAITGPLAGQFSQITLP